MTIFNELGPPFEADDEYFLGRDMLGAVERRRWCSHVRQSDVSNVLKILQDPQKYGAVVIGPWGSGKTILARNVEAKLAHINHVIRLFGSPAQVSSPFGSVALLVARLPETAESSLSTIISGIAEMILLDAVGHPVLLVVDDLPELDAMSVAVIMHLVLSGAAKILVLVRQSCHLPEDLLWLVKDGLLAEVILGYFNRSEISTLIARATKTFISESAVTALHVVSNGNPLVLHTLFWEQVANGNLVKRQGGWGIAGPIEVNATSALSDIVRTRLAIESAEVRLGIEKLSLIRRAPLPTVLSAIGDEVASKMEERGFLSVNDEGSHSTSLRERYIADVVRGSLTSEYMASLFRHHVSDVAPVEEVAGGPEVMSMTAWALDAGVNLSPCFAMTAATMAIRYFDPLLAIRCTSEIPADHALRVQTILIRAAAHYILAEYVTAAKELEENTENAMRCLDMEEYAQWILSLTGSLLKVQGGFEKIQNILVQAQEHVAKLATRDPLADVEKALRRLRLAHCLSHVHHGDFAGVADELEVGSRYKEDLEFSLNCACLLVPTWAVMGREVDAIALAKHVKDEVYAHQIPLIFTDYCWEGANTALIWSGRWVECLGILSSELERVPQTAPYLGVRSELSHGLALTYAGRGQEAIKVLKAATAQLEVRDCNNALGLAYSALAFAYAQTKKEDESTRYLAYARSCNKPMSWIDKSIAKFCRQMARRWLGDSRARDKLYSSALKDITKKRYSTASMSLFGGTLRGTNKDYALLEKVSSRRQGPMSVLNVTLARSCRLRDARLALKAADLAAELTLDAVESRCTVLAIEFARLNGEFSTVREAVQRLERITVKVPIPPIMPSNDGVQLTQRERQIAKLATMGLSNKQIADRIGVSQRTVEGHLYQAYNKLGISARADLEQEL